MQERVCIDAETRVQAWKGGVGRKIIVMTWYRVGITIVLKLKRKTRVCLKVDD